MKKFYRIYLVKGDVATLCQDADTPVSRGLKYAEAMGKAFARKEGADGFQVVRPDGVVINGQ